MDAIEKLAADTALKRGECITAGELVKEAKFGIKPATVGKLGGLVDNVGSMAKKLFTRPAPVSEAMSTGARTFSPKRALATAGLGYGGYGAHQFNKTRTGGYDQPVDGDYSGVPGWRRANRQQLDMGPGGELTSKRRYGQTLADFFKNPGRTLAEGFGYGEEGPVSHSKDVGDPEVLRSYIDPETGQPIQVTRQNQETTWRPDAQQFRDLAPQFMQGGQQQFGENVFRGMDLPSVLGQQSARRQYEGLPNPGPLTMDYSMYNYGI